MTPNYCCNSVHVCLWHLILKAHHFHINIVSTLIKIVSSWNVLLKAKKGQLCHLAISELTLTMLLMTVEAKCIAGIKDWALVVAFVREVGYEVKG